MARAVDHERARYGKYPSSVGISFLEIDTGTFQHVFRGVIHFKGEAELLGNLPAVIDQDRKCRARHWHCQRNLGRPPATPRSSQRWRRTAAIELRAAHGGRYCSIHTRCHDRKPQPEKRICPSARCSPRLHISPSAVGNEKSGAISPTPMEFVLALNALVAGPIWPPNRTLACSTPRRAISLSVNSAREAAMGTADRVERLLRSCFLLRGYFPLYAASIHNPSASRRCHPRRPSMKNGLHPARLPRANVRFGSFACFRHVRVTSALPQSRPVRGHCGSALRANTDSSHRIKTTLPTTHTSGFPRASLIEIVGVTPVEN